MAKKRKPQRKKKSNQNLSVFIVALLFILFGLFGLLKLGFLGMILANVMRFLVGDTYGILAVAIMIYGVAILLSKDGQVNFTNKRKWFGALLIYIGVLTLAHARLFGYQLAEKSDIIGLTWQKLFSDIKANAISQKVGGGMIGASVYGGAHFMVSQVGSYIIIVLLIAIGAGLLIGLDSEDVVAYLNQLRLKIVDRWGKTKANIKGQQAERNRQKELERKADELAIAKESQRLANKLDDENENAHVSDDSDLEIASYQKSNVEKVDSTKKNTLKGIDLIHHGDSKSAKKSSSPETEIDSNDVDFKMSTEAENQDYILPSSTLLTEIPATDQSGEYAKIEEKVKVLERTFASFNVDAKVVRASLGPSVTKFEIEPAIGVKVSKIVNLTDDLALALAAKDVRMEAPIPGKSLIGIEVPNSTISMVSFRDVVEAQTIHQDKMLEVPLGRDVSGNVISADLSKMPHLLIAGSTGSGKSVCINTIITSILMRAKPHEVKLMMIDPKMVELNVYNGIPHLLTPVVTNPKKASQALHKVVEEMERRYELFAGTGVRNMSGYNKFITQQNTAGEDYRPTLPYIVVIVDELADLMMVASNEVEDAIIRLAQMARAAGIHMILATQRPSVDVITGIIKANVPSRIAFAVSSGTDSRTIIDSNGAEKLLGRGDMLFLPMGENKPIRVQGAFIPDEDVESVVEYITDQQGADYQEEMMPVEETEIATESSQDELYDEAVALVVEMQTASVSLLQRRFRIGYNRAARLVDEMENCGIVGPHEGSKPRKVLIDHVPGQSEAHIEDF